VLHMSVFREASAVLLNEPGGLLTEK